MYFNFSDSTKIKKNSSIVISSLMQGLFRSVLLKFQTLEDFLATFYFLKPSFTLHGHINSE